MGTILKSWWLSSKKKTWRKAKSPYEPIFLKPYDYISDRTLWLAIFALATAGLVMVYSSSFIYANEHYKDGLFFFKRHLIFLTLGVGALFFGFRLPLETLRHRAFILLGIATVLLLATFIPGLSHKVGGARRWLQIGFFTLQPAEIAKIAVLCYLATQLQRKENLQTNWRTGFMAYFTSALPIYLLLMLQPDFGTTALLLCTTVIVLWVGGVRLRYLTVTLGVLIPTALTLVLISPYRRARIDAFLNPWHDAAGKGFQIIQSLLAVYAGKWFGVGLGNSKEKLFYLPEAHNDFIFAVVAEELGLLGIIFFVSLFLIIIWRGLNAAQKAKSSFERGLAAGISAMIGLQAFFNMGVVLGLLPTKGMPLPLVSYGGTSLVCTLFLLGILAQLSEKTT